MRNLKLTSLEEAIMLSVLDEPRYGQDIVDVVSAASSGAYQISCGTLYPALRRLEKRNLIQARKVREKIEERNGHSRRYYKVTQEGKHVLSEIESIRIRIRNNSQSPQTI